MKILSLLCYVVALLCFVVYLVKRNSLFMIIGVACMCFGSVFIKNQSKKDKKDKE